MSEYKFNTKDLFEATNGGLDIIHKYYDDSVGCEKSSSKKFRIRDKEDDPTPSACLTQKDGIWFIKDFGDKSYDPVSAVRRLTGKGFYETLQLLYAEFGLSPKDSVVYSANIDFKENKENLPDDYFSITTKDFENLDRFGRFVTAEIAEKYNVVEVDSYTRITKKEKKVMTTSANENYPIFAYSNDLKKWAKTYQPAEFKRKDKNGKTRNFKHGYLGKKDDDYIHGLDAILNVVNEDYINELYKKYYEISDKKEKKQLLEDLKEYQVKNIILCSGGSDGLNVASLSNDYYPIWLNSEGAMLSYEQYTRISMLCQNFYNLPDIDSAGIQYAYKVSNTYWNIKNIWLPKEKMGKNGKDFRDWLKFYQKSDKNTIKRLFDRLMAVSLKCNFFEYNEKGTLRINKSHFHYFLNANNYYSFKENKNLQSKTNKTDNEDTSIIVKIDGHKVTVPEQSELRNFAISYVKSKSGINLTHINLIKRSHEFRTAELKSVSEIDLDFSSCDRNTQYFYFKNGVVKINKENVSFSTKKLDNRYVWNNKIIDKQFTVENDYFEYYKDENGNNRVRIIEKDCQFLNYSINASRVYWQKEIVEPFETVEAQENYRNANLFTLNGSDLSEKEQITQEQHFLNKCFSFGYLAHRYKREDFAKLIFILDDAIKEHNSDANGGTGKSLSIRGLKEIMNIYNIDGKAQALKDDKHLLAGVTLSTDLINVEDIQEGKQLDQFYNNVTSDLDVRPMFSSKITIPFALSPKIVCTSNFAVADSKGSSTRRVFYVSYSDYYHPKTKNFTSERRVSDDFGGKAFFQDWNDEQYNKFFNFIMQCCKLYLNNINNEFTAPMGNISKNNLKAKINDNFTEWAEEYFLEETNFNRKIPRADVYGSYKKRVGDKSALGVRKFKETIENYCLLEGYIFNPKELRSSDGRIKDIINDNATQKRTTVECFFIAKPTITVISPSASDKSEEINDEDNKLPF